MLFGESTSEAAAHQLLSEAAEAGINFFDSAEMYPVPQRAETQGRSEAILGAWIKSKRRCLAPYTDALHWLTNKLGRMVLSAA